MINRYKQSFFRSLFTVLFIVSLNSNVFAVPALQMYIEGSVYDQTTETWVVTGNSFNLWVLAATSNNKITDNIIYDIKLTYAYNTGDTGSVTFTPATTSNTAVGSDNSTPLLPVEMLATDSDVVAAGGFDGTAPHMGDGSNLPAHGMYGDGKSWGGVRIGDMDLQDSLIGDYIVNPDGTPVCPENCSSRVAGQVNVYVVEITGFTGGLHFDAFDHYIKNDIHTVFAPFSHDAELGTPVPEPTTLLLFGSGFLGLLFLRKRFSPDSS